MIRSFRAVFAALAVAVGCVAAAPASAQTYTVPEIGFQDSGTCPQLAIRDRGSKTMVPFGCVLSGGLGFRSFPAMLAVNGVSPLDVSLSNRGGASNGTYKNPNAVRIGAGNMVSFCPALSCLSGDNDASPTNDHQRASLLVSSTTQDDVHSQEQSFAVITTIDKGRLKTWAQNTAYTARDNVKNGENVYRVAANCTSSSTGGGPTSLASSGIADGSCSLGWINYAGLNAKAGSYFETKVVDGAGSAWGAAFNYHLDTNPNIQNGFFPGLEVDYANTSGIDCLIPTDCTSVRVGIAGNGMITHGMQITGDGFTRNSTQYNSMLWALRINGEHVAQEASIEIDSQSKVGIGFGTSGIGTNTHSVATIKDATTSPTSIEIAGSHTVGLNLSGTFSSFALASNNFLLYGDGSVRMSNSNASTSAATGALQIPNGGLGVGGAGNFGGSLAGSSVKATAGGTTYQVLVDYDTTADAGRIQSTHNGAFNTELRLNPGGGAVSIGPSLLRETSAPPSSSGSACVIGTRTWDASYEYRCVATNTWKRAA
ncbi:hypothetical protein, partial [Methylorubrum sp. Q1]|uniref:hypothetical protein n=1 Tax=Methylorubrum sp. Q1 TaxID=2562453 RepID=UPI00187D5AFB